MISDILEQIRRKGIIHPGRTPYISNLLRHIKLYYFPKEGPDIFIKITKGEEAKAEYLALTTMKYLLVNHMPLPLMLAESHPHTALVSHFIHHRPLTPKDLLTRCIYDQITYILKTLIMQSDSNFVTTTITLGEIFTFVENEARSNDLPLWTTRYVESIIESIHQELPKCQQHGDLTIYNFGISGEKTILFDWEDYGKLDFAGYDIATFLFSLALDLEQVNSVYDDPVTLFMLIRSDMILSILASADISQRTFLRYFPFFILTFLYLKYVLGYGTHIKKTTLHFLQGLFTSKSWKDIMITN